MGHLTRENWCFRQSVFQLLSPRESDMVGEFQGIYYEARCTIKEIHLLH